MKFHMLMFMNAWMMLVLMKCKCQMQFLTLGCYIGRLMGRPPLDYLRWPPPLHGGFRARLRVHPHGAFAPDLLFEWATLCFFGLDAPLAFPDCIFCHVFHSCVQQNKLVPKLMESVS